MKRKINSEKGSITTVVTVTVLFFVTILSTSYAITATIRQSQLKSQLEIKNLYQNQIENANAIAQDLIM